MSGFSRNKCLAFPDIIGYQHFLKWQISGRLVAATEVFMALGTYAIGDLGQLSSGLRQLLSPRMALFGSYTACSH